MASGDAIQQIKDRISIIDVISPYVELHKAGKSFKGKSPFTNEKTPSFHVSPDRGMYYCFSSSQGGDMFTFIEKMEGVDFKGALKILAEKAGVELVPEDPKKRTERETLYAILEAATNFFANELQKNKEAQEYLNKRGVKEEIITKWRIGYVPGPPNQGWRHAREHLKGLGYSDELLLKAGLIKSADAGKEPYDVFRDRIMFPIFDASGRVVAFSGRILNKDSEAPKYVNSPETILFNKSEVLYGYDRAKEGIRKYDFSLIVEGQFDVVMSHQAGYNNAVAVSGTALTNHHVGLLQRLSNRVVLALDSDRAGIAAVKRAADIMLVRGVDLKVASLPDGNDPADLIKEDQKKFREFIGKATHVIDFLLRVLREEVQDDRQYKLRVRDEVIPYLLKIESHIDRDHFIGIVAAALGTKIEAISLEVARLEEKQSEAPELVHDDASGLQTDIEDDSLNRLSSLKNYLVSVHDLLNDSEQRMVEDIYQKITNQSLESLKKNINPDKYGGLIFTLEENFVNVSNQVRQEELASVLTEFHTLYLKKSIKEKRLALQKAEMRGENDDQILQELSGLQKLLSKAYYSVDIFS